MKAIVLVLGFGIIVAAAGCTPQPVVVRTYQNTTWAYPDDLPNDRGTILAFLDLDNRNNDNLVRPLRAFSAQEGVGLIGVMTYSDNSYLTNLSTRNDITFPVLLDPRRKLADRLGVGRYPTYVLISVEGREIAREYEVRNLKAWYNPLWVDRSRCRLHKPTPEDHLDE